MKRSFISVALATAFFAPVLAHSDQQQDDLLNIKLDARADFQQDWDGSDLVKDNSGFNFKSFNIRIDGSIIPGLTYSWRQRFNKNTFNGNFFDSTDWIYLDYQLKDWNFTVGKQTVAIGGYEYDIAPINLFSPSVFTANIPCYDIGVAVGYKPSENDHLKLQVVQSPFYTQTNKNMYAYNLFWTGNHGIYHSLWSVNMVEYDEGKYINYIALGNRFDLGKVTIDLDLMNRAAAHQTFFFKDCSAILEVGYRPHDRWKIWAKGSYDVNKSGSDADVCVLNGTELKMVGGGVEFYPLKHHLSDLRLHANVFYSWGNNSNTADVMQNKTTFMSLGITWNMNVLNLKRKPKSKS
ncbi:MAG: OprO/OprP family phosphate-selective porin [Muribaculum sp.]|nr:OprO/OprP family phosphate-selective porin [Muribaculum sp.]